MSPAQGWGVACAFLSNCCWAITLAAFVMAQCPECMAASWQLFEAAAGRISFILRRVFHLVIICRTALKTLPHLRRGELSLQQSDRPSLTCPDFLCSFSQFSPSPLKQLVFVSLTHFASALNATTRARLTSTISARASGTTGTIRQSYRTIRSTILTLHFIHPKTSLIAQPSIKPYPSPKRNVEIPKHQLAK